ncbi:diguanylate cyclase, partial [Clostridium boliviensis]
MWKRLSEHFLVLSKSRKELKQEGIRICVIYFLLSLFWILSSDRLVPAVVSNFRTVMLFSMMKGVMFVLCTTIFLYYLIIRLLNKAGLAEEELGRSYEELKTQYEKIGLYDQKLLESEEKYRTIIAHMQLGMALFKGEDETDIRHYKLIDVNPYYEELACDQEESVLGRYFCEIHDNLEPDIWELLVKTVKTGEPARYERFQHRMNVYYEVIVFCPGQFQLALIINNITERRLAQQRLNYLSYHDPLTGLYNRRYFEEQLRLLDQEYNYPLVITMADINGLKLINDSFGHSAGDEYIRKAAAVLRSNTRSQD